MYALVHISLKEVASVPPSGNLLVINIHVRVLLWPSGKVKKEERTQVQRTAHKEKQEGNGPIYLRRQEL